MATLIPDHLPSTASQGERRLSEVLRKLPGDCVVYHEPLVDGRHPDFVVLMPTLGVLVLEVKGWYAGRLRRIDGDKVLYERDGRLESERSPEKQVREYLFLLMDEARKHRWSQRLLHTSGPHQGRFRFPFASLVILSNISEKRWQQQIEGGEEWARVFPRERTLTRDDLIGLDMLSGRELVEAIRGFLRPSWPFLPLVENEIKALRAVVHPEILLGEGVRLDAESDDGRVLDDELELVQVLDKRQENCALNLGSGHRIIHGVAGSGKTVILLARAKRLAEHAGRKILIVCYNRALAAWIKHQLKDCPAVEVKNFHALAWQQGLRLPEEQRWDDEALGKAFHSQLRDQRGKGRLYDAVLVDEAQDFEPNWFPCLLALMKDPEEGDLLIVADGCQSLYRRTKVRWSHLGIRARGRTTSTAFHLDHNYRNAREIIALAETFAYSTTTLSTEAHDGIEELRVNVARCERSSGVAPLFLQCANRRSELYSAHYLIKSLMKGEWHGSQVAALTPGEIGILYPRATKGEKDQLRRFTGWMCAQGIPTQWVAEQSSARDRVASGELQVQTIHSAKGLQYRAVILIWADKLPHPKASDEEVLGDRRLLYVGMTRAVSFLAITASATSAFTREISSAPAIDFGAERDPY